MPLYKNTSSACEEPALTVRRFSPEEKQRRAATPEGQASGRRRPSQLSYVIHIHTHCAVVYEQPWVA